MTRAADVPFTHRDRLFMPDRPVFATRELKFGERVFAIDEEVPWQELEVTELAMRQIFFVRHVEHWKSSDTQVQRAARVAETPGKRRRA